MRIRRRDHSEQDEPYGLYRMCFRTGGRRCRLCLETYRRALPMIEPGGNIIRSDFCGDDVTRLTASLLRPRDRIHLSRGECGFGVKISDLGPRDLRSHRPSVTKHKAHIGPTVIVSDDPQ